MAAASYAVRMTVPNPGALPAPATQQPLQQPLPQPTMAAQPAQPPPRPPLSSEAAHRARLAGGVGGGIAWLGLGIVQVCAVLLLLGLGIPALLLGVVAWQGSAPDAGAEIWPAVLPWLGSPTAIVLMVGIPLGLIIALLGLWLSARMLRRPGLARPVGVTWAAFGISLVAASLIGGIGSAVCRRMVWASTTSSRVTGRMYWPMEVGLFGTLGARAKVKTTSSAVKGLPSWKVTPSRSLNSQVRSSIGFQLVARPGSRSVVPFLKSTSVS